MFPSFPRLYWPEPHMPCPKLREDKQSQLSSSSRIDFTPFWFLYIKESWFCFGAVPSMVSGFHALLFCTYNNWNYYVFKIVHKLWLTNSQPACVPDKIWCWRQWCDILGVLSLLWIIIARYDAMKLMWCKSRRKAIR